MLMAAGLFRWKAITRLRSLDFALGSWLAPVIAPARPRVSTSFVAGEDHGRRRR